MNEIATVAGTAVVQWDPNSGAALPAYLSDALDDLGTNIPDRQTVPSLSYEGKVWQIVKDGNRTKLQAQNSDGDMVPIPIMRLVILDFNNERGRAYYPGLYNPSQTAQPDCWSADGKTPDPSANKKQAALCSGCPQSVKGSKVQDGKEMVACGSHRMIVIAPAFDIASDPLRLKIAVTSDYDKEVVEHGWFAFRQYVDFLKSRGVTHTALVVTKVKFDNNTAFPKLLFALDRVLGQEEVLQVKQALANPKVPQLLSERWSAAGTQGTPTDDSDIKPAEGTPAAQMTIDVSANQVTQTTAATGIMVAEADGWITHPDAPGYHYKGQEVVATRELAGRYPIAAAAPAAPTPVPEPVQVPTAPPSEPTYDPIAAAEADGWVRHPEAADYHYKGQEVVATAELVAKYPPAQSATPAAPAGSTGAAPTSEQAGASTSTTATSGASPSETAVPADVQSLLDKWTS